MTELKPCPTCAGRCRCISTPLTHDKYLVLCLNDGCGNAQDKWYDTKEEAIEAWNRRANDANRVDRC